MLIIQETRTERRKFQSVKLKGIKKKKRAMELTKRLSRKFFNENGVEKNCSVNDYIVLYLKSSFTLWL